jgi:catechol-2,3-dioxygenase
MSVKSAVTMLNVADIDRAVAFYRDGLGLHVVTHTPHWSELTAGPARIALIQAAMARARTAGSISKSMIWRPTARAAHQQAA